MPKLRRRDGPSGYKMPTYDGEKGWRANIWDPRAGKFRRTTLFPRRAPEAKEPSRAPDELRAAWEAVAAGRRPAKKHAVERAKQLAADLNREFQAGDRRLLTCLVEREIELPGKRGPRSPSTQLQVTRVLRAFRTFMEKHHPRIQFVEEVRKWHLEEYRSRRLAGEVFHKDRPKQSTKKGAKKKVRLVSETTTSGDLTYIKRMFQRAVEEELIDRNPGQFVRGRRVDLEKERQNIREYALRPEDIDALLKACRDVYTVDAVVNRGGKSTPIKWEETPPAWLYPFVFVAIHTTCRKGELLGNRVRDPDTGEVHRREGLTWDLIDWQGSRFYIDGKTGPRAVPMTDEVQQVLADLREFQVREELLHPDGVVFVSDMKKTLGEPVLDPRKAFDSAVARAGIKRNVRIHDLRHTGISKCAVEGLAPAVLQRLAGHSTITTTEKYLSFDDDQVVDAVRAHAAKVTRKVTKVTETRRSEAIGGSVAESS